MIAESVLDVQGLEKVAQDLANQVGSITHQYGPQTMDLILGVERVSGLEGIIPGFCCLVVCIFLLRGLPYYDKEYDKFSNNGDKIGKDNAQFMLLGCLFFAVLTGIGAFIGLGYVWNWVAVFYPQIALAHDVIQKVMK